jgi:oxygen-independent coproporphyrinogen-3 oxidase
MFGVPGQSAADLRADIEAVLAIGPQHISWYELEAKPGTRFAVHHGAELERQAEALEDHYETVVAALRDAGYRWYETANFCRVDPSRDLRARHNLAYWHARDYLGLGIGAVSTVAGARWQNKPSLARYCAALERGEAPPREMELLDEPTRSAERVMLGLRLDEPLSLAGLEPALDGSAVERLTRLGLVERRQRSLRLTPRGRFLGGGVTAELLADRDDA